MAAARLLRGDFLLGIEECLACRAHWIGWACQGDGKACENGAGPLNTPGLNRRTKNRLSGESKASTMFIVVTGCLYHLGIMVEEGYFISMLIKSFPINFPFLLIRSQVQRNFES